MTTIRRARLSFGVIAIVAIILLSIAIAFLLNALLPDSGHARNIASIIQSFVTAIAILAGAYYAQTRLHVFRTFKPHLTIDQEVTHRRLGEEHIHIGVTTILRNNSQVHVGLQEAFAVVAGMSPTVTSPISVQEVDYLYSTRTAGSGPPRIRWPEIERQDPKWDTGEFVVEPGEAHAELFEFIIDRQVYESVLVYTYFHNPQYKDGDGTAKGWAAATVYDIMKVE